ncbi:MAG: type II toxin-antitoxin system HipA family toxin [Planctomycetes bacterium]|nr:type II toxin-antitoxin system HipA family toxin [Planctomycetota bacterium]
MTVEVHVEYDGECHRVGSLHAASRGATVAFEYEASWLTRSGAFAIDPTALPLRTGAQHAPNLFSAVQDCGPDRWGRMLIDCAVRKRLLPDRPAGDLGYVLALDDGSRIGALRFRRPEGPFLAATHGRLPPVVRLPALLRATDAIHREDETAADLRFLLGEGSPLGGARPKSVVVLGDGALGIAKFRKPDDTRDIAAGEVLALRLATAAGVRAAACELVAVGRSNAVVVRRFDRDGVRRVPMVSAATLVGASSRDSGSYQAIAEGIRRFGDDVAADLAELWRRMVFNLLVANCDDHLRNHAFVMVEPGRWRLAPAYDINPVPTAERGAGHQTPLDADGGDWSIDAALALAAAFGLSGPRAKAILREVATVVGRWRELGRRLRLSKATLDQYASAFDNDAAAEVRRLLRR